MSAAILAPLAWLGRAGTWALPAGVLIGLVLPDLAAAARPLFVPTIFVMLTLALVRVDPAAVRATLGRPARPLIGLAWIVLASPVVGAALVLPAPVPPELKTAMVIYACCPPVMAAVAYAVLLRLDSAFALVVLVTATLLSPLAVPPLVLGLIGVDLAVGVGDLMLRLGLLVGLAAALAQGMRWGLGERRLARGGEVIDGLIVVFMTVFALAIMDGVTARLLAAPGLVALYLGAAFVLNLALQALGLALSPLVGRRAGVTLAMMTGHRNMGLLIASLGGLVDEAVFLFFALAQIPIYALPALLAPVYRRLIGSA